VYGSSRILRLFRRGVPLSIGRRFRRLEVADAYHPGFDLQITAQNLPSHSKGPRGMGTAPISQTFRQSGRDEAPEETACHDRHESPSAHVSNSFPHLVHALLCRRLHKTEGRSFSFSLGRNTSRSKFLQTSAQRAMSNESFRHDFRHRQNEAD
jgi:hypothetical protein